MIQNTDCIKNGINFSKPMLLMKITPKRFKFIKAVLRESHLIWGERSEPIFFKKLKLSVNTRFLLTWCCRLCGLF
jgi:hypothetical protein